MRIHGTAWILCAMVGAAGTVTAPTGDAHAATPRAAAATAPQGGKPAKAAGAVRHGGTAASGGAMRRSVAAHRGGPKPPRVHHAARDGRVAAAPALFQTATFATEADLGGTGGGGRASYGGGGLSCVPYARMVTGMNISGNGGQWWYNSAGSYDRGQRPEPGAIMSFRSSGGMSRGHVAVVSRVLGPRHVEIDHSNWGGPGIRRGTVMRGVDVIDVSDRNDWTAVRVQVGWDAGSFGRTYPTHGFIYNRPDRGGGGWGGGLMTAQAAGLAQPSSATLVRFDQVAEAADAPAVRGWTGRHRRGVAHHRRGR